VPLVDIRSGETGAVAAIVLSVRRAWVDQELPVRLPICNFDAKTGILCANCESRLRRGEISKADVEASKAVVGLADRLPELGKVTLKRAFEVGGAYVLEFEQQDLAAIRSNPSVCAELEGTLKGKAWVVGAGSTDRKFLEDIFFPARVLTVNTVWLPDGGKKTKVIVPARRSERRIGDFDKLREAVRQARGIELLVETEREAALSQYS
jgi:transcription antitermination factor NusA-like protein